MFFEHKMSGGWRSSLCVVAWLGLATLGGAAEIHDAVMAHDLERVRRLAQANPKVVNERTEKGDTPLFIAAFLGQSPQMVPLLLSLGADVNPPPNLRLETPLSIARELNRKQTADLLLRAGAREDDLSRAARIRHLVGRRELRELDMRLLESPHLVNARDGFGQTPLSVAVTGPTADLMAARLLLARGADPNLTNRFGGTPYSVALDRGHTNIAELFRQHGAKENPISLSAPLRVAARLNRLPEATAWLKEHPNQVNAPDDLLRTPLLLACTHADQPMVALLLQHGADVNAVDFGDNTPLHAAANAAKPEIVAALLAKQADPLRRNRQRVTPLHNAALRGSKPMVEALLKAGADLRAADNLGETALHRAGTGGHLELLQLLLDLGFPVDERDHQGQTALHQAAQQGHLEAVRLLLKRKADPTLRDVSGQTPAGLAARRKHEEVVQALAVPAKP